MSSRSSQNLSYDFTIAKQRRNRWIHHWNPFKRTKKPFRWYWIYSFPVNPIFSLLFLSVKMETILLTFLSFTVKKSRPTTTSRVVTSSWKTCGQPPKRQFKWSLLRLPIIHRLFFSSLVSLVVFATCSPSPLHNYETIHAPSTFSFRLSSSCFPSPTVSSLDSPPIISAAHWSTQIEYIANFVPILSLHFHSCLPILSYYHL